MDTLNHHQTPTLGKIQNALLRVGRDLAMTTVTGERRAPIFLRARKALPPRVLAGLKSYQHFPGNTHPLLSQG